MITLEMAATVEVQAAVPAAATQAAVPAAATRAAVPAAATRAAVQEVVPAAVLVVVLAAEGVPEAVHLLRQEMVFSSLNLRITEQEPGRVMKLLRHGS